MYHLKDTMLDSIALLEDFPDDNDTRVLISCGRAILDQDHLDVTAIMDWMDAFKYIVSREVSPDNGDYI